MKKLIVILLAIVAIGAQADDFTYKYLVMSESDGAKTYLDVEDLELTFANGVLSARNSARSYTFTLASLSSMQFAQTSGPTTAVSQPSSLDTQSSPVEVFTLSGVSRGSFSSLSEMKSSLPAGIYLVKQNGTTTKITVRK